MTVCSVAWPVTGWNINSFRIKTVHRRDPSELRSWTLILSNRHAAKTVYRHIHHHISPDAMPRPSTATYITTYHQTRCQDRLPPHTSPHITRRDAKTVYRHIHHHISPWRDPKTVHIHHGISHDIMPRQSIYITAYHMTLCQNSPYTSRHITRHDAKTVRHISIDTSIFNHTSPDMISLTGVAPAPMAERLEV